MKLAEAEPQIDGGGGGTDGAAPDDGAGIAAAFDFAEVPTDGALPADGILAPVSEDVPVATGPVCRACGTPLSPEQDWCLDCGTAAATPGRLPGLRAVGIAGVLALVLAGGAVAASYAALTDEAPPRQTKVKTVAQAAPPPPPEELPPVTAPSEDLPPVDVQPLPPAEPVTPVPAAPVTPPATPATGDTTKDTKPKPKPKPKPVDTPVVLAAGAGSLYDPNVRASASGDPQRAIDGDGGTSWFVTTPADGDMKAGYLLDLGEPTSLEKLRLLTKTSGFSVEVLAAKGADPPQAPDDQAWIKIGAAGSVDATPAEGQPPAIAPADGDAPGDGALDLKLDAKDAEYQQVLFWVTVPPGAGPTVRFTEIKLFG